MEKIDRYYNYKQNGYVFLGWQNGWRMIRYDEDGNDCKETGKPQKSSGYSEQEHPEYCACKKQKHQLKHVQHDDRGYENTVSCPICKIYFKYDCSD